MIAVRTSPAKPTAPRNYRLDVGLGKIKVNALLIDAQLIYLFQLESPIFIRIHDLRGLFAENLREYTGIATQCIATRRFKPSNKGKKP